jgi:predicted TIM-barrel fold metal-dependent hydrolase
MEKRKQRIITPAGFLYHSNLPHMLRYCLLLCLVCNEVQNASAQKKPLPVIDMHLHAMRVKGARPARVGAPFDVMGLHDPKFPYSKTYENALATGTWCARQFVAPTTTDSLRILTFEALEENNVYAVTSGDIATIREWKKALPSRILPAVDWNFGLAKNQGLTPDSLERIFTTGEFKVFGEITIQYEGYTASDTTFDPYLAMAEKLDIPVGIHLGPGPAGAPYLNTENYRARLHSPFGLEEALLRHPKLRVYAMHAGWPMLDEMIAMLYTHPQLYVDIAGICYMIPKKEFYAYLRRLVEAGFGKRILFGSDNMLWPQSIGEGIRTIYGATFLTQQQKRDILFNNAARFLRLTNDQIKQMHDP